MSRRPPDPTFIPHTGRVICRVCDRPYQHGSGSTRTQRHLRSKPHRAAAAALGRDPDVEDCMRALCELCGGVANDLVRHTRGVAHRAAAAALGLPVRQVRLP
jgi:hypothetical protein